MKVAPLSVAPWGEDFERRMDPRNRPYFWATGVQPQPPSHIDTDLSLLREGYITLTPLKFDMTARDELEAMQSWQLGTPFADINN
ncbi:MAG: hypothetical protein RID07_17095 [Lacipirellulaceae bacterium]